MNFWLGTPIPPPPENVPAIEPDIRGAKTIRELLAKHRSSDDCATCHVKIDPPGFALENFDPAGKWRDFYQDSRGRPTKLAIDAGYVMPDGREFDSFEEFRQLVTNDPKNLARNVAEKLITYGTGAEIEFVDRPEVEQLVERAASSGFGLRSMIEQVIVSDLFLTK